MWTWAVCLRFRMTVEFGMCDGEIFAAWRAIFGYLVEALAAGLVSELGGIFE